MGNTKPVVPLRGRKNLRLAAALEIVAAAAARDNAPVPFQEWLNKKQRVEDDKGREPGWTWLMLGKDGAVLNDLAQRVVKGPRAAATLAVWVVLPQFIKIEDGLLLCSQSTLAKASGISQPNVNRALKRLAEIGALLEAGDGRYRVHPDMLWFGDYNAGREAAAKAPPLALGKKRGKFTLVEA